MELRLWWVLTLGVVCVSVHCQQSEKLKQNPCTVKQTCHECIQTPTCAWCSQPEGFVNQRRCFQPSSNQDIQCGKSHIVNLDNEHHFLVEQKLRKSSSSSSEQEAVQISPQLVSLKLRVNEVFNLTVDFAQAEDYPVDLYYLMDLSNSMRDDKEELAGLGDLLAKRMRSITRDFRLGFGSFVDKIVFPFASTLPARLERPCSECEAPYGFHHHMKLTDDTAKFNVEVNNTPVSGNMDDLEGGFDAIMQAVVCQDQIGWREKARKLLLFTTDYGFHFAGDGKMGGIVKPNDELCHLDTKGNYTHSKLQDYPSISQIGLKVKQNAVNIIFAVTTHWTEVYEKLAKRIEGSSVGVLSNNSNNIVDLVQKQYDKITSSVEMKDNATGAVKVTYYSRCLDRNGPLEQTNKCDGLQVGTVVKFEAKIVVKYCPKNPKKWKQVFQIQPVGINESLTVDLEMLCSCPCEHPGNPGYEERSSKCSDLGTYKCGVCECDRNHSGQWCECENDIVQQTETDSAGCRLDNTTLIDCSHRGVCVCGQCTCHTRENPDEEISGAFCQCDNFSCDRHDGVLCSGSEHGKCVCGKCECEPGWTGSACDCQVSSDSCIPPGGGEICSGRGVCHCGECQCNQGNTDTHSDFSGLYCEKCSTCPGRCDEFKDCVQCQMYKTGPLTEEECKANCTLKLTEVDVVEDKKDQNENFCAYRDKGGCLFSYVYLHNEKKEIIIKVQKERKCPLQDYVLGIIILAVVGAILLIGLGLVVLWKVVTMIHDRKEYERFEKERAMAKWNENQNPMYKQPDSTFKNPLFEENSSETN